MTGPIQRAFVEILPEMRNFGNSLRTQVRESVATSTHELDRLNSGVTNSVNHAERAHEGLFRSMRGQITELAAFALPALGAVEVFKFIKESITASREEGRELRQTAAVIKSTGSAAHVTARDVADLAKQQSIHTGIVAQQIQANENLLLTFTGVRNEVGKGNDIFNQATKTVLDMSVALKEDGKAASIQLGKALNDPVKGYTALKRVGVTFTDQQKEQIKTMVKAGNTIGAQKVILHELSKEFGGSAAAQANASDKMKASFHALTVELGNKLVPILDKVETFITNHVLPPIMAFLDTLGGSDSKIAPFIKSIKSFVAPLVQAWVALNPIHLIFKAIQPILPMITSALTDLANVFGGALRSGMQAITSVLPVIVKALSMLVRIVAGALVKGLHAVAPVLPVIAKAFSQLATIIAGLLMRALQAIAPMIPTLIGFFQQLMKIVISFIQTAIIPLLPSLKQIGTLLINLASSIMHALMPLMPPLLSAFKNILNAIKPLLPVLIHLIKDALKVIGPVIRVLLPILVELAKILITVVAHAITIVITAVTAIIQWFMGLGNSAKLAWHDIRVAFTAVVNFFKTVGSVIAHVFGAAINWLVSAGRNIIHGLWIGIKWYWDNVLYPFYVGIPRKVINFFSNAISWLVSAGRRIFTGLQHGISAGWNNIVDWLVGLPDRIGTWFGGAIGWLKSAGVKMFTGLLNGITDGFWTIVHWFEHLPGKILHALGIASPPKWAITAGHWIIKGLHKGLTGSAKVVRHFFGKLADEFVGGMIERTNPGLAKLLKGLGITLSAVGNAGLSGVLDLIGATSGGTVTSGMGTVGKVSSRELMSWIVQAVSVAHAPTSWIAPLIRRAMFESSGNPFAQNNSDQNARAGHPSKGLMQTIDSTFNAYHLPGYGDIWDPIANVIAAIRYIRANYGSIFSIDPPVSGYAKGSWRIPETGLANLHKNEMVLPAQLADAVRQSLRTPGSRSSQEVIASIDEMALTRAIITALNGARFRLDANGFAYIVTKQQALTAVMGTHR